MPPKLPPPSLLSPLPSLPLPRQCICQTRSFSHTRRQETQAREQLFSWLHGPGKVFEKPLPNSTNYLSAYSKTGQLLRATQARAKQADAEPEKPESDDLTPEEAEIKKRDAWLKKAAEDVDAEMGKGRVPKESMEDLRPFPLNWEFVSQPVLSEELRDAIYRRVAEEGGSVRAASVEFGVSMERVGAVVRLKAMERQWVQQHKPLAAPYSRAVLSMLPTTPYDPGHPVHHESINDLPVHPATTQQIFHPTAESRPFTRRDAARVFRQGLRPADQRIPHPELVEIEKAAQSGRLNRPQRDDLMRTVMERESLVQKLKEADEAAREQRRVKVISRPRHDFKVENVSVEAVGKTGRKRAGVGWRYGMPLEDRKRGQVRIPTRVD
ncbi:hypothetical protein EJ06DRAFT_532573 [Trichodelitschia bisporula]|uniref:Eukaryotic mitochondrial regulator protein-domain-containing protein n=1 Tax=Trichodelitschia bisporula TaxID=703511 RepID=A0A6G1HQT6_9PEZI|nr:hypothetical protein EJ06DRAFT_532573 [Trichodelitschia bisporula]